MGLRAGLKGCGKSRLHRDWIPRPSSLQRVAVPTELSRPTRQFHSIFHSEFSEEGEIKKCGLTFVGGKRNRRQVRTGVMKNISCQRCKGLGVNCQNK